MGADPFAVRLDELHSATEADIDGRATILAGTNNYLGLTFDPDLHRRRRGAVRRYGTGTTGSRIANGTYALHTELEAALRAVPAQAAPASCSPPATRPISP